MSNVIIICLQVQQELEKSIKDLFILQIMNKHANKDQESLNSIIEERLRGVLADHEYMDIVNYLYNEKDATQLRIILGVECQEANDKREEEQVNPRRHFEYKNDNITDENDMKVRSNVNGFRIKIIKFTLEKVGLCFFFLERKKPTQNKRSRESKVQRAKAESTT